TADISATDGEPVKASQNPVPEQPGRAESTLATKERGHQFGSDFADLRITQGPAKSMKQTLGRVEAHAKGALSGQISLDEFGHVHGRSPKSNAATLRSFRRNSRRVRAAQSIW